MKPDFRSIIALSLAITGTCALAQTNITAYNTYQTVPFTVEGQPGLAGDLVGYLNCKLKGKYVITLQNMPRERLNREIIDTPNFKGIVVFLSPAFVGDVEKKKYSWTAAIMADKNNVISSMSKKIEYKNADSLKDLQFAGIRGNKYSGLEDRFGKDIKRTDFNTELQILKTIASERADVALMAASTYNYLMKTNGTTDGLAGKMYVSATPHLKFDRFMFVSNNDAALSKELSAVAGGMASDPEWNAILTKYGAAN